MSKCKNCGAEMAQGDIFCRSCGTKHDPNQQQEATPDNSSLFLKYCESIPDETLFRVACAKSGLSGETAEVELMFERLAMRNHIESMYKYAMILIKKERKDDALKWLRIAAEKGHAPSQNYLSINAPSALRASSSAVSANREGCLSGEEIYACMENAAVEIIAKANERTSFRSSGFIVSRNGFIITNAHAILDEYGKLCTDLTVKLGGKTFPALPVAFGDPATGNGDAIDIALLYAPGVDFPDYATLGSSETCRNGQKVYLIGNSLGSGICITSGIISDSARAMPGLSYPYIMTDAAANHGNSGGPLLNEQGKVIGVLVAGIENAEGMNYAIPIDMVKEFLQYIANETKLNSKAMGGVLDNYSVSTYKTVLTERLFKGIHLVVDIIAFILGIL